MTAIGFLIEGQYGLNWPRWQGILKAAEDFGYKHVFRSDHYTIGPPDLDSLELWVSLTYAASHTSRIEFGSLVTPVTFRHPPLTARMAAAVDDLSNGRLVLGMGAGWHEREHRQFGVPLYDVPTRFEMFEEALQITLSLLRSDTPVSFEGKHFSLEEAILLPRPQRPGGPPILIGGNGPKRTLPLVARYASEWNADAILLDELKEKMALLDELIEQNGRQPADVKRSLVYKLLCGKDEADLQARLEERGATADELRAKNTFVGTTAMLVDDLGRYADVGVERFMLQWLDLDDIDGLEMIASEVLPHFHTD